MIYCSICGKETEKTYSNSLCKNCYRKKYDEKYRNNNREKIRASNRNYANSEKGKKKAKEWKNKNLEKSRAIINKYNNSEKGFECRLRFKPKKTLYDKIYLNKNKNKINERIKNYRKERYKKDIEFNIRVKIKSRFKNWFNSNKLKKTNSVFSITKEDFYEIFDKLKRRFSIDYPDLVFEDCILNGKEWHIDHIIPVSFYDLTKEEDAIECFSSKNLRLIYFKENLIKSNKVDFKIMEEYNEENNE